MKAKDFDAIFDAGEEDVIDLLDLSRARRPNIESKRINIDCPTWMVDALDEVAAKVGVTRQSVIKLWLVERLKQERES
jgi:hypothetical protein